jgi:hypothetical protein
MFEITISGAGKATRRYDLRQLRLPSGRVAHQIGVPSDGWQQLALYYAQFCEAAKPGPITEKIRGDSA